jgi:hypothetical protein
MFGVSEAEAAMWKAIRDHFLGDDGDDGISIRIKTEDAAAVVTSRWSLEPGPEPPSWGRWKRLHQRAYVSSAEEEHRHHIYALETAAVRAHNARAATGLETYTQAVNGWSDLTSAEWVSAAGLQSQLPAMGAANSSTWLPDVTGGPTSLDWREKGAVTEVKNQGGCGGCWAFGATGTMEGAWALAGHKLVSLSEEQLLHCSGQGCSGGNPGHAIEYVVRNHGIDSEHDYRYTAKNGKCDGQKASHYVAAMHSVVNVHQRNERQLLAAVMRQPVAVAIDAEHGGFRSYHRGVMGGKCGTKIDHSVLIVGFGEVLVPPPPPPVRAAINLHETTIPLLPFISMFLCSLQLVPSQEPTMHSVPSLTEYACRPGA